MLLIGTDNLKYVYCEPDYELVWEKPIDINYTKAELKTEIDKLFGNKLFFYKEDDNKKYYGRNIVVFRTIVMNENLSAEDYIFYYAHESAHLTLHTYNDIDASFKAFKMLYESGNELFKQAAMNNLYYNMLGCYPNSYTYWYYAKEYLLKN